MGMTWRVGPRKLVRNPIYLNIQKQIISPLCIDYRWNEGRNIAKGQQGRGRGRGGQGGDGNGQRKGETPRSRLHHCSRGAHHFCPLWPVIIQAIYTGRKFPAFDNEIGADAHEGWGQLAVAVNVQRSHSARVIFPSTKTRTLYWVCATVSPPSSRPDYLTPYLDIGPRPKAWTSSTRK